LHPAGTRSHFGDVAVFSDALPYPAAGRLTVISSHRCAGDATTTEAACAPAVEIIAAAASTQPVANFVN
jgi:hypothetical protein